MYMYIYIYIYVCVQELLVFGALGGFRALGLVEPIIGPVIQPDALNTDSSPTEAQHMNSPAMS